MVEVLCTHILVYREYYVYCSTLTQSCNVFHSFGTPTSGSGAGFGSFGGFNKSPSSGFGAPATFGGGATFGGTAFGSTSPGKAFGGGGASPGETDQ